MFPFILWVIAGGLLFFNYTSQQLFSVVNMHYTPAADVLMYYITMMGQAEVIVPVLAVIMLLPPYRNAWYFITALLSNIIPVVVEQGLKSYYDLPRPINYYHHATWIHRAAEWPELLYRSFPSGHSEGAFAFLCFLSLLLPARYRGWGAVFFLLALSVCYSRLYLAAHFFADVYAGSIIGFVVTTIIFTILNHYKSLFFKKKAV